MTIPQMVAFKECIEIVEDPRVVGRSYHSLESILFIVIAAVISGAEGFSDIENFGKAKQTWIEQFVELPYGVPSHDTIRRVLSILKPDQFQKLLLTWIQHLRERINPNEPFVVAIDGKTARGSYTNSGKTNAIHIVSAWATDYGLTLGQVAVAAKSNEITAIPEVLDLIDVKGAIVTIDAMGCQKAIAAKIIDCEADYTLAVKKNHPKLQKAIREAFRSARETGLVESNFRSKMVQENGHGRIEAREYVVAAIPQNMKTITKGWKKIKSICETTNTIRTGDQVTVEVRHYISSRSPNVGEFAKSVRKHWGIESMHWVLDVVFKEDTSRIRMGHAVENMSFTRRFVTSLLKQDTSRTSLKAKIKMAGWCTKFLEKVLFL